MSYSITPFLYLTLVGLLLFLLCSTQAVQAQIIFDAASSADTGNGSAISRTFPHTVTNANSDRVLIVGVSVFQTLSNHLVNNVSYAGANLTHVGTATFSSEVQVELWQLIAPATGVNNVVVTMSSSVAFVAAATSFTGVHQTTPFGSFFSATGDGGNNTHPIVSVTNVNSGEVVIDVLGVRDSANLVTVGAGQTARWNRRTTGDKVSGAGSSEPRGASSTVNMSWTMPDQHKWALGAVALKPTANFPNIELAKSVTPNGSQPPDTDLIYTVDFSNTGKASASLFVIIDSIPANTDFKVSSPASNLGTTGLTSTISHSNNGGATWTYTPTSGTGGAPAGFDRTVSHVRWSYGGTLSQVSPNNSGSVSFAVRIR